MRIIMLIYNLVYFEKLKYQYQNELLNECIKITL
ncbi:MAG: hypothetical protein BWY08_00268 [Bacteroidetes bacterium ADurb.Bin174]|nr:MAG: hypothetical protein BWY08_00268 [Bacteroidetes bacterium ADurb.Bin174]